MEDEPYLVVRYYRTIDSLKTIFGGLVLVIRLEQSSSTLVLIPLTWQLGRLIFSSESRLVLHLRRSRSVVAFSFDAEKQSAKGKLLKFKGYAISQFPQEFRALDNNSKKSLGQFNSNCKKKTILVKISPGNRFFVIQRFRFSF